MVVKAPILHAIAVMAPDFKMKHGILWIGFGSFAKRLEPHVLVNSGAEVLRYLYPNKDESIRRFGPKACWDLEKSISDPEVTIVFITTPNDQHTEYLKAALKHGKHIFVEKPITARLSDTLELLPKLRENKNILMVGHNMRRKRSIRRVKTIVSSEVIGQVVNIYANLSKGITFDISSDDWRFSRTRHREGPLITVGVHLIDVLHYLFGPVNSVSAVIKNISGKTEAPDSNAVLLNFESGTTAFLEANYNTPSEDFLYIFGTKGSIYLNRENLYYRLGRDKNRVPSELTPVTLGRVDTLAEEMQEFFTAIEEVSRVETGYQEALNALTVVEACYRSHQSQKWIEIKSVTREYFQNKSA